MKMDWGIIAPFDDMEAIAEIKNHGYIKFEEKDNETLITVDVYGFKEGKHGFHIHEKGTVDKGCGSLCAHYNPFKANHGGPQDNRKNRHVGDLGNIDVDKNGVCKMSFTDKLVKLSGEYSVLNRSIVIHEDQDDLGKGGDKESLRTGNAGKRIACGKIEKITKNKEENMDIKTFFDNREPSDVLDKIPDVKVPAIVFNSKSSEFYELSNFYGGAEPCYMKDRFEDEEVKALFDEFNDVDEEKFLYYLKKLQPEKKDWTPAKERYWFKDEKPITGILSKLAGSAVKDTASLRRRLKIIGELAGLDRLPKVKRNLTNEDKVQHMLECLRIKYSKPYYRKLLMNTGDAVLHEKPMRGKGDFWTYPGEDTLGKCLMKVREEIKNEKITKN